MDDAGLYRAQLASEDRGSRRDPRHRGRPRAGRRRTPDAGTYREGQGRAAAGPDAQTLSRPAEDDRRQRSATAAMSFSDLSDWLLAQVPLYGPWLLGLTTFLSCLAIPVPSSLMMIASGAFVASGDLDLATVAGAAFTGAILGDQLGFQLGRRAERFLPQPGTRRGALVDKAMAALRRRGAVTVFFTRWMFSALGPWVNLAAGASGFAHRRFTLADLAGEAVWVTAYVGLGITFGANLDAAAELAGNALGLLGAGAAAFAFGWWLWHAAKRAPKAPHPTPDHDA
ncbi:hypothetical protein B6V73_01940 [Thioclava sp. JM3]|nr:hypothetical protein B6V73_01940 [Thioclava sp. JM3]